MQTRPPYNTSLDITLTSTHPDTLLYNTHPHMITLGSSQTLSLDPLPYLGPYTSHTCTT